MTTLDQIIQFVKNEIRVEEVLENSDIENDLGCTGDDFSELIEKYGECYQVDMSSYLWYFHHFEEGFNFPGIFFKSPNAYVSRIPVTPKLLLEFAKIGKWDLAYPQHTLPKRRYDIVANQVFSVILIVVAVYLCLKKLVFAVE